MQERMSLKHKNTSKWAKEKSIYAKYNLKARDEVKEQLEISKELTKKLQNRPLNGQDDSDNDKEVVKAQNGAPVQNVQIKLEKSSKNPWISFLPTVTVDENNEKQEATAEIYKKPEAFVNKEEIEKAQNEIDDEDDEDESDGEDFVRPPRELLKSDNDSESEDEESQNGENSKIKEPESKVFKQKNSTAKEPKPKKVKKDEDQKQATEKPADSQVKTDIDPNRILLVNEDDAGSGDDDDDICDGDLENQSKNNSLVVSTNKNEIHRLTLSEAFADDDVIEEFKVDKVNYCYFTRQKLNQAS
jgi:U3 small nucleolar RNA-associated protein 14